MNILLATYNYYPYNWGGSEIYVSGLARYLINQGNLVYILAAMPDEAFENHQVVYRDAAVQAVNYIYDGVNIVGVRFNKTTIEEIYSRYHSESEKSFHEILKTFTPHNGWDICHVHAHTGVISKGLLSAIKKQNLGVKIIASYHTPLSCVKDTLMIGNELKECNVKANRIACTSCVLTEKSKIPLFATSILSRFIPSIKGNIPAILKIKFLINEFVKSFHIFLDFIDIWHVFSNEIRDVLIANSVPSDQIVMNRHGVNEVFYNTTISQGRRQAPIVFLFVGRFKKIKGFETLLKAWQLLEPNVIRQLWLVGDTQKEDESANKLKEISTLRTDIIWYGQKDQKEIAALMSQAHCVIIPSEWVEIGPLVFHEAISRGCDVISSDIGGCGELSKVYHGKTVNFKAGNEKDLAKKIMEFNYSGLQLEVKLQEINYREVWNSYHFKDAIKTT